MKNLLFVIIVMLALSSCEIDNYVKVNETEQLAINAMDTAMIVFRVKIDGAYYYFDNGHNALDRVYTYSYWKGIRMPSWMIFPLVFGTIFIVGVLIHFNSK